jgi:hypothetical protein
MFGLEGENDNAHDADYEDELENLSSDELVFFFSFFACWLDCLNLID